MSTNKPNPTTLDFSGVSWMKSPFSGESCVEFGAVGEFVAIRDSKRTEQTPLVYTRDEIKAMVLGAKAGEFDHFM